MIHLFRSSCIQYMNHAPVEDLNSFFIFLRLRHYCELYSADTHGSTIAPLIPSPLQSVREIPHGISRYVCHDTAVGVPFGSYHRNLRIIFFYEFRKTFRLTVSCLRFYRYHHAVDLRNEIHFRISGPPIMWIAFSGRIIDDFTAFSGRISCSFSGHSFVNGYYAIEVKIRFKRSRRDMSS